MTALLLSASLKLGEARGSLGSSVGGQGSLPLFPELRCQAVLLSQTLSGPSGFCFLVQLELLRDVLASLATAKLF